MKSGFVALVGRPNVGKSSLLNSILEQKLAIVSNKISTRNRILGIYNAPEEKAQVIFVDLPGIIKSLDPLGDKCLDVAFSSSKDADVIVFILDATSDPGKRDMWIRDWLAQNCPEKTLITLINKIDLVRSKEQKSRLKDSVEAFLAEKSLQTEIIFTSSVSKEGVNEFLQRCQDILPEGEAFYPDDTLTDQTERFIAAEFIREKALQELENELPHAIAVLLEEFQEGEQLVRISAKILVERESQKLIVIGKGGKKIKAIGVKARAEIEKLLGKQVYLELKVKVFPTWREDKSKLRTLGYL